MANAGVERDGLLELGDGAGLVAPVAEVDGLVIEFVRGGHGYESCPLSGSGVGRDHSKAVIGQPPVLAGGRVRFDSADDAP